MRRPLIGEKDFKTSIGQGEQAQGWVMGCLPRRILCVFGEKKKEDECVREKLILMCEKMLFMKKTLCANKEHRRKLYVASSCSGVHGRISMTKPLDFYLK
jgi:hypothetical protein